ncbi:MAG: hypothetical protein M1820_002658 [Bogoriella megaspora]|nr:MAG: hypothetical protein M1820_002658 [Bogoriella megaspora]
MKRKTVNNTETGYNGRKRAKSSIAALQNHEVLRFTRFFDLPAEIRTQILRHTLPQQFRCRISRSGSKLPVSPKLAILRVNKQVYAEAKYAFYTYSTLSMDASSQFPSIDLASRDQTDVNGRYILESVRNVKIRVGYYWPVELPHKQIYPEAHRLIPRLRFRCAMLEKSEIINLHVVVAAELFCQRFGQQQQPRNMKAAILSCLRKFLQPLKSLPSRWLQVDYEITRFIRSSFSSVGRGPVGEDGAGFLLPDELAAFLEIKQELLQYNNNPELRNELMYNPIDRPMAFVSMLRDHVKPMWNDKFSRWFSMTYDTLASFVARSPLKPARNILKVLAIILSQSLYNRRYQKTSRRPFRGPRVDEFRRFDAKALWIMGFITEEFRDLSCIYWTLRELQDPIIHLWDECPDYMAALVEKVQTLPGI